MLQNPLPAGGTKTTWMAILARHPWGWPRCIHFAKWRDVVLPCQNGTTIPPAMLFFCRGAFYTTAPVQGDQNAYESKYLPDWHAMYAPKSCERKDLLKLVACPSQAPLMSVIGSWSLPLTCSTWIISPLAKTCWSQCWVFAWETFSLQNSFEGTQRISIKHHISKQSS